nr:TIGR02281 family clan AA aspartic protease [Sphingomonas japonica]
MVVSALTARRVSFGMLVRSFLGWAAVAAIAWVAVVHRYEIESAFIAATERMGLAEQTTDGETVRIRQAPDGHFYASVTLDGTPLRMMVDSGATITAISAETAANAEIDTDDSRFPVMLTTANGTIAAKRGNVDRVTLGAITTHDLGVVVSPAFGDVNVLGMNFLSRLASWRVEGGTLILVPPPPNPSAI